MITPYETMKNHMMYFHLKKRALNPPLGNHSSNPTIDPMKPHALPHEQNPHLFIAMVPQGGAVHPPAFSLVFYFHRLDPPQIQPLFSVKNPGITLQPRDICKMQNRSKEQH